MPRSKKAVGMTPDSTRKSSNPSKTSPTKTTHKKAGWQERFLTLLSETFSVTAAAAGSGTDRSYAYHCRRNDPDFAEKWDAALNAAIDRLEQAAYDRAIQTSDTLAIFLLKTRRPDLYRDQQHVQTTQLNINYSDLTEDQLERLANGEDPAAVLASSRNR